MERLESRIEEVVEQKHVHAATAEECLHHAAWHPGAADFAALQIDEDRLSLSRELRLGGEPLDQAVNARSDRHDVLSTGMLTPVLPLEKLAHHFSYVALPAVDVIVELAHRGVVDGSRK